MANVSDLLAACLSQVVENVTLAIMVIIYMMESVKFVIVAVRLAMTVLFVQLAQLAILMARMAILDYAILAQQDVCSALMLLPVLLLLNFIVLTQLLVLHIPHK